MNRNGRNGEHLELENRKRKGIEQNAGYKEKKKESNSKDHHGWKAKEEVTSERKRNLMMNNYDENRNEYKSEKL